MENFRGTGEFFTGPLDQPPEPPDTVTPAVGAGEQVVAASEPADALKQIRELQRMLGKKTMENKILREAMEYGRSKKNRLRARPRRQGKTGETSLWSPRPGALEHASLWTAFMPKSDAPTALQNLATAFEHYNAPSVC